MNLVAYHNDQSIKDKYLNRVRAHREADELVQLVEWKNGRGCAIGCTLDAYDHAAYEKELGLPEWLARLEECIFEGLINDDAQHFPEQFLAAIPVGATEFDQLKWQFCAFVLRENIARVFLLDIDDTKKRLVLDSIRQCLALHEKAIESGKWDSSAAWSAESAAWSARSARSAAESAWPAAWSARSAARSAAESAAESAAWSAAESARSAAESADSAAWCAAESAESARRAARSSAESAADSAAWSAAESAAESADSAAYRRYREELLRLLRDMN